MKNYFSIYYLVLFCFNCMVIVLAGHLAPASATEADLSYERLWPRLVQPWYFNGPGGIATDSSGHIYIADTQNNRIQKLTSDGSFITTWGGQGDLSGQFSGPRAIAVDTSGNIYVADTGNQRVQKFTSHGSFVSQWGSLGISDGQFSFLYGIATDTSGNVYVSDSLNNRVQKFSSSGSFITKWGSSGSSDGQFKTPWGIAVDASGNVYVADSENNRIQKFTSDGSFVLTWGSSGTGNGQFSTPKDIDVDSSGNVFVTDAGGYRIQKFTSSGVFVEKWGSQGNGDGQFADPQGIALDTSDNIYVADSGNHSIHKFSSTSSFVARWGSFGSDSGHFGKPFGIAVDASGNVYVADSLNDRIQVFTSNGTFASKWGSSGSDDGKFSEPRGITIDASGNIYVVDAGNHRIQKFSSNGAFITKWGSSGSGQGQFNDPTGIATDSSGNVYVADRERHAIQKFTSSGSFLSQLGSEGTGNGQFKYPYGVAIDPSDNLYVADSLNRRIQKLTSDGSFVTKWGSFGSGDGQFIYPFVVTTDSTGNVYVVDTGTNFITGYWNHRIQKFSSDGTFVSKWGEFGSIPGQFNEPEGMAVDSSGNLYLADSGNHRIQLFSTGATSSGSSKAIVLAGGGDYQGNNLWDATQLCANYAYRTLAFQGYTKDTIYYLTSDTDLDLDGNGILDDVDASATNSNLQSAITSWAADAGDLVLYITNHGGDKSFRMTETELLSSQTLNGWLNQLQASLGIKVTIIYDACQAGSFVSELASTAYDRIFIASTSEDQQAYFTSLGQISFSYYFWGNILNGMTLYDAYVLSKNSTEFSYARQNPVVNADGNSTGNEDSDYSLIEDVKIGNGVVSASDIPVIGSVSGNQTLNGESQATITATNVTDANGIGRVWAIITPPSDNTVDPSDPVLTLPEIELTKISENLYQGSYNNFILKGTYNIAFYARDTKGTLSIPVNSSITQTIGDNPASQIKIKDVNVTGTIDTNSPISFSIGAESSDTETLYYRYTMHPDYGTSGYDGSNWSSMTQSGWSSSGSVNYTFTQANKYIVVAWIAETDTNVNTEGVSIFGLSVDTSTESCKIDVTGCTTSGSFKTNEALSFKIKAQNACNKTLYYRFSFHPDYGTSGYNGLQWTSMTDTEWVSTDTISYTFTKTGKYIVLAWISDDPNNYDPNGIPIIGWSVKIE